MKPNCEYRLVLKDDLILKEFDVYKMYQMVRKMSENKTMEQHILNYLNTKPYKHTIIFNVRDIFHSTTEQRTVERNERIATESGNMDVLSNEGWSIAMW